MTSLFLKLFLRFCAATTLLALSVVAGYVLTNPDQIPYAWPRVGRGAIVFAGRFAVQAYQRGGIAELTQYLESLRQETGMRGALFDAVGHELSAAGWAPELPSELNSQPESQLVILRKHIAAVRLPASGGDAYAFVVSVPRREASGIWSWAFFTSFLVTGGLLCFLLARNVTAPVVHLRELTSRFSNGDLSARVTTPAVLKRNDEIGGLARDFNQMALRIEMLMRAQQRLIADVSHELRSPITRLSLALGLIRRRLQPDSHISLARMQREVERLDALIAQLLTLSRLECLDQPPPMDALELGGLVREVASDADFEATSMDRSVRLLECAGCSIRGARDLLRSAVENVVRNALKYTGPNTQVSIRLLREPGNPTADIVVDDTGPGVPPEVLDQIFEPFYRADAARDRRSGGAGLGLAIARQIVTLHGGAIRASNRPEGGLEVRITLPVDSTFSSADKT